VAVGFISFESNDCRSDPLAIDIVGDQVTGSSTSDAYRRQLVQVNNRSPSRLSPSPAEHTAIMTICFPRVLITGVQTFGNRLLGRPKEPMVTHGEGRRLDALYHVFALQPESSHTPPCGQTRHWMAPTHGRKHVLHHHQVQGGDTSSGRVRVQHIRSSGDAVTGGVLPGLQWYSLAGRPPTTGVGLF
jgi:hypothetical protein